MLQLSIGILILLFINLFRLYLTISLKMLTTQFVSATRPTKNDYKLYSQIRNPFIASIGNALCLSSYSLLLAISTFSTLTSKPLEIFPYYAPPAAWIGQSAVLKFILKADECVSRGFFLTFILVHWTSYLMVDVNPVNVLFIYLFTIGTHTD